MATQRAKAADAPLVVIVGPTASGKTGAAIKLAKKVGGEIICADSRTIYKYMDIGTAKPTSDERKEVLHWGLDLVEPGMRFTAADFKIYALAKIREIRERGNVPFLVGGTGLYVDAVLFDYQFVDVMNTELRATLEKLSTQELQLYCLKNSINLPTNNKNRRHLIQAIERNGSIPQRKSRPISNSIIVGIATERDVLMQRISERTEQLFENGVVEESIRLGKKYGWNGEAFKGNIYRIVRLYLLGELKEDQMKDKFTTLDRQLAKRQLTWFKRNSFITWLPLSEVDTYITERLANRAKA